MNDEINKLRSVVADEGQPLPARKGAAEHLLKMIVDAIPDPADDDSEVIDLMKPWDNPELAKMFTKIPEARPVNGYPLSEAKSKVHKRHRLRAVLSVVVDESVHPLERLAACGSILNDHMHPQGHYNRNSYTPEKLLGKVKPANAVKWDSQSWKRGPIPVNRPPMEMADVWDS